MLSNETGSACCTPSITCICSLESGSDICAWCVSFSRSVDLLRVTMFAFGLLQCNRASRSSARFLTIFIHGSTGSTPVSVKGAGPRSTLFKCRSRGLHRRPDRCHDRINILAHTHRRSISDRLINHLRIGLLSTRSRNVSGDCFSIATIQVRPWNHQIATGRVISRLHLPRQRGEATLTRSNTRGDSHNPRGVIRGDA